MDIGGIEVIETGSRLLTAEDVAEVTTHIERLEAENAKLREERDHWHVEQVHAYGNWEDAYKRATELEAENAKLRELCADIYKRFRGVVFECWAYSSEDFRMYEQRMRELGIEVSDG